MLVAGWALDRGRGRCSLVLGGKEDCPCNSMYAASVFGIKKMKRFQQMVSN